MRAPIELALLYQDGGVGVYASLRGLRLKSNGLAGLVKPVNAHQLGIRVAGMLTTWHSQAL